MIRGLLLLFLPFMAAADEVSIALHDGEIAKGHLHAGAADSPAVILFHQCNRTQALWSPLVALLREQGYSTLTVDLRGYGESATDDYDVLRDGYRISGINRADDLDSFNAFWRETLPDASHRVVVGASCGGGMATQTVIQHGDIDGLVLFSPSLRRLADKYRARLDETADTPVLAITSIGDENADASIELVFEPNRVERSRKLIYKGERHGEPLFEIDPALPALMAGWIRETIELTE